MHGGVFRIYWGCGQPDGLCDEYAANGHTYFSSEPVSVTNPAPSVCDIQDPGAVLFKGTYYMFAEGIKPGAPPNAGCNNEAGAGNEHAAIYEFTSGDGVNFSVANNGNPVIVPSPDQPSPCWTCYVGHGYFGPSPVVMESGSLMRVYFTQNVPGYGIAGGANGIVSLDTTNGTTFSNPRLIMAGAYWANVKRVGLYNGDYPMVMTYNYGGNAYASTSSTTSDAFPAPPGVQIATNPTWDEAPTLESDEYGLFLNANGGAFSHPVSGQMNFWWGGSATTGKYIWAGETSAAHFFSF